MPFALDLSNAVILDTETTGVGDKDEIIELAILRADNGETLINQRFKPRRKVSNEAFAIHGIDNQALLQQPSFSSCFQTIMAAVAGKIIVGWRIHFDIMMLLQTMRLYHTPRKLQNATVYDVKGAYLKQLDKHTFNDHLNQNGYIHLATACEIENIHIKDLKPHQAISDCQMIYRLIHNL
ncbi:MAG: hypothetical protein CR975_02225 [Gammaproteobacteria bacterium]|nr:MAG: hypothetical protein CR975_02225 [Gammaproteobacteria bacterium]